MTDFVEWNPKHHGHKPLHWTPDMLTSVDGKNFARQPNWAWIAGSTYYVPHEAVGVVREDVEEETGVDRKLLCAREAAAQLYSGEREEAEFMRGHRDEYDQVWCGKRAIELWEEGFGK
jgi:hypothetical protein